MADSIGRVDLPHPIRVAVDGRDAVGKTTLADELAERLRLAGCEVIRASIDGFHRPRTERYRQGELSPRGYYEESFDHGALRRELLDPLGPGGSRLVRTAVYDHVTDAPRPTGRRAVAANAVLVLDGVFLLRPELDGHWDVRILVAAADEVIVSRARARDAELFGSPEHVEERYLARYLPAHRIYEEEARPADRADFVVANDDPAAPTLTA